VGSFDCLHSSGHNWKRRVYFIRNKSIWIRFDLEFLITRKRNKQMNNKIISKEPTNNWPLVVEMIDTADVNSNTIFFSSRFVSYFCVFFLSFFLSYLFLIFSLLLLFLILFLFGSEGVNDVSNRIEIEFGSVSTRNASESVSKRKLFGAKKIKRKRKKKTKKTNQSQKVYRKVMSLVFIVKWLSR